ncbi:neuromedin-U receptor 2 [Biomphalaria glabrata]|nr:neuromedin-U receptor 2 [Biomphalaria glabrata]
MNETILTFDCVQDNQLVSRNLIEFLEIIFIIPSNFLISMTGMLANLFNVMILTRLGFKQSMSYGTMALSLTDLMVSSLQWMSELCYVLDSVLQGTALDFMALGVFPIGWLRYAGLYISGWITALIATERCFCVVFPFNVKHICSKSIYALALFAIYIIYLSFVVPIIVIERLTWHQVADSSSHNSSLKYILTVVVDAAAIELEKLFDSVCVFGLALLSQLLLIVSTFYMVHSLRSSSRIRKSLLTYKPVSETQENQSSLSLKEKKLIIVAVRLAVIVLACSVPRYFVIAIFTMVPTLQEKDNLPFVYFLFDVSDIFINVNCFCTFFVYFSVNRNFKRIFLHLVCSKG